MLRIRYHLEPLMWDEKTAEVAFNHSIDMYESDEISHTSKKYGELSDRLDEGEVAYKIAAENIAANYIDAPAVVEGWLNSKDHRDSLLNEDFTTLGSVLIKNIIRKILFRVRSNVNSRIFMHYFRFIHQILLTLISYFVGIS